MKLLRVLAYFVIAFVLIIICGLLYVNIFLPSVEKTKNISKQSTEEMIQRGNYLANHVMICMDCHSIRDWDYFSGPLKEGTLGAGGEKFNHSMGFPGEFYSKNITPYNLKNWTNDELFHLITTGVNKDGDAIFPVMPYHYYGQATKNDIEAVIAYIRTLNPIESEILASKPDFPMNIILNFIPRKAELTEDLNREDAIQYGKYLTTISACAECHTPVENGQIIQELKFSGGREFQFPDGSIVRSSNLTSGATGIGNWSEEQFVMKFKEYVDSNDAPLQPEKRAFQTIMPWTMYGGMKEDDLRAIYAYLKTLDPIENEVVKIANPR